VTHPHVADLDVLLVSPAGVAVLLTSDAGGAGGMSNATLIFSDSGKLLASIADEFTAGGSFHPVDFEPGDTFVAPPPAGQYSNSLNSNLGDNANGTWKLFVIDDSGTAAGGTIGGWSITFGVAIPSTASSITYQGQLILDGIPVNGSADFHFSLWDH